MKRNVHFISHPRRRAAGICLLLLATLHSEGAFAQRLPPTPPPQQDDAPTPQRDHDPHHGGDSLWPWALGAAAAAFGALLATPREARSGPAANDDYLAQDGPRPAYSYRVGTFVIEGYIRDGWPLVVDFLPQPDSCTAVDVYIGQKRVFSRLLDADGNSGRRLLTMDLPGRISPRARAALYVVHSESPACARGGGAADAGVPVEVYGIGAGPRAVGSVAVDGLVFAPAQPKLPQELVQIGYRTQWEFSQVSVEILRYRKSAPDRIDVERVHSSRSHGPLPGPATAPPWDGRNDAAELSLGLHRLQVRAWLSGDDRSWVGAISPESVRIVDDAGR